MGRPAENSSKEYENNAKKIISKMPDSGKLPAIIAAASGQMAVQAAAGENSANIIAPPSAEGTADKVFSSSNAAEVSMEKLENATDNLVQYITEQRNEDQKEAIETLILGSPDAYLNFYLNNSQYYLIKVFIGFAESVSGESMVKSPLWKILDEETYKIIVNSGAKIMLCKLEKSPIDFGKPLNIDILCKHFIIETPNIAKIFNKRVAPESIRTFIEIMNDMEELEAVIDAWQIRTDVTMELPPFIDVPDYILIPDPDTIEASPVYQAAAPVKDRVIQTQVPQISQEFQLTTPASVEPQLTRPPNYGGQTFGNPPESPADLAARQAAAIAEAERISREMAERDAANSFLHAPGESAADLAARQAAAIAEAERISRELAEKKDSNSFLHAPSSGGESVYSPEVVKPSAPPIFAAPMSKDKPVVAPYRFLR